MFKHEEQHRRYRLAGRRVLGNRAIFYAPRRFYTTDMVRAGVCLSIIYI